MFRTFVFCEKWKKYETVLFFFQTSDWDITPISYELKNATLNTFTIVCFLKHEENYDVLIMNFQRVLCVCLYRILKYWICFVSVHGLIGSCMDMEKCIANCGGSYEIGPLGSDGCQSCTCNPEWRLHWRWNNSKDTSFIHTFVYWLFIIPVFSLNFTEIGKGS